MLLMCVVLLFAMIVLVFLMYLMATKDLDVYELLIPLAKKIFVIVSMC